MTAVRTNELQLVMAAHFHCVISRLHYNTCISGLFWSHLLHNTVDILLHIYTIANGG